VSHLLNRSLHLHIGTRTVRGVLRPAWSRSRVLARSRHVFGPSTLDLDVSIAKDAPEDSYSDAIQAVVSELDAEASAQMARLKVVLSDSRAHYDVATGDYRNASDRQLQTIATSCVSEVLGERATSQVVRWQLQPDGRHLLISSIDTQDVETLVQTATRLQLHLYSLQTEFCTQWNLHSGDLPDGTGVFSAASAGHFMAVYALRGSIVALTFGPFSQVAEASNSGTQICLIDERVDRLLASIGCDVKANSTFLLVASDNSQISVASRWTVMRPTEDSV
jgi:hypothetical protein